MAGFSATQSESAKNAKKNLQRFLKKVQTVPTQILEEEATTLYAEIIAETPFDTGRLENSVKVRVSKNKRRPGINASASARDPRTGYNYAGIQHENTSFDHPIKGKAHYISDPFDRAAQRIKQRVRDEVKYEGE